MALLNVNGGLTVTGDSDLQSNLKFNSSYGSSQEAYGVRAWIKFNGTGTVAINGSGGVSALTDNDTGDYTITFDRDWET